MFDLILQRGLVRLAPSSDSTYLVVVLTNQLPVVTTVGSPGALINIVVKVKVVEALLFICSSIQLLPGNRSLRGVKVDPDKAELVNVSVDGEEAIVLLTEVLDFLELGGLGQIPRQTVRPAYSDVISKTKKLKTEDLVVKQTVIATTEYEFLPLTAILVL